MRLRRRTRVPGLKRLLRPKFLLISKQNKAFLPKKIPQVLAEVLAVTFHKKPTR
jgi:hypothetical protein